MSQICPITKAECKDYPGAPKIQCHEPTVTVSGKDHQRPQYSGKLTGQTWCFLWVKKQRESGIGSGELPPT